VAEIAQRRLNAGAAAQVDAYLNAAFADTAACAA
jgi:hypothetical protein